MDNRIKLARMIGNYVKVRIEIEDMYADLYGKLQSIGGTRYNIYHDNVLLSFDDNAVKMANEETNRVLLGLNPFYWQD